jgi:hypothetical protein
MKQYYECHVTMVGDPKQIRPVVEELKWKFSVIDGDPVMGEGVKCYATRFFNIKVAPEDVVASLMATSTSLSTAGCEVIRRKTELVVFDDRASKVRCTGGCVECHLDDINKITVD